MLFFQFLLKNFSLTDFKFIVHKIQNLCYNKCCSQRNSSAAVGKSDFNLQKGRNIMSNKKAVLVTSFGTSHLDTLQKTIAATEQAIAAALPDFTLRRAFTSTIIMRKLKRRDGLEIDDVTSALSRLVEDGYTQVVIQPTHILCGEEYEKLCALTVPFLRKLTISMGTPLLQTIDQHWDLAKVMMHLLPEAREDEAILFMGHGSPHHANAAYALLQYLVDDMGAKNMFIGTVEGCPTLEQVIRRMHEKPEIRKVTVLPLMVVAGDHASNDMAGDEEDSWKNILIREGYEVNCLLKGLGEDPEIQALFAAHAAEAAEKL